MSPPQARNGVMKPEECTGSIRREDAKQEKALCISTPACASKPSVLARLDSSDEMAWLPRVQADLSALPHLPLGVGQSCST